MAASEVTALARTLREVLAILPAGSRFALIGGLAVSARTEPRFTRDIDFALAVANDAEAEATVFRFIQAGFQVQAVLENTKHERLATMRLRKTSRSPIVDLLFSSSGIEPEIVEQATTAVVRGEQVPVACVGHLIAMKLVARDDKRRPQDVLDLHALAKVADVVEWTRAERAVALIAERGYDRGRDLGGALAEWRRQARDSEL